MRVAGKITAFILGISLLLSGCATTRDEASMTPAEKRMREQAATFNQTIAEGAALGCVAGMLIGVLASGRGGGERGRGIALGCAAGAAVGGAAGYYVADKQEEYASTEERLEAMTTDVRADNQRLADLIDASRQVIATDTKTIERLEKQIAAGQISREKARTQLADVDDNTKYLEQTVANLKKRHEEYAIARGKTQGSKQKLATMDAEISRLEQQISVLEKDLDSLVQRRKVSRIG